MEMYYKTNDFHTATRVWNQMKNKIKENEEHYIQKYGEDVGQMEVKINKLN
jgi:hypothetical protein